MMDDLIKKDLLAHKIYSSWQFIKYTEKNIDISYAYISTNSTFDAMPDELYILLVVERENEVYSHECPFNTIFITGMSNVKDFPVLQLHPHRC